MPPQRTAAMIRCLLISTEQRRTTSPKVGLEEYKLSLPKNPDARSLAGFVGWR